MSVNGEFREITRRDLLAVADRFGIERAAAAITRVRDVVRSWPEFAAESGLDARLTDLIAADFVEL
ncbi:MAG: hypothetical protein IT189_10270 [Microbacteriaceae bacterium]|nr:hypothetical protein [Microbacteriaceae bacterium]